MVMYWGLAAVLAVLLAYTCLGTLTGDLPAEDPRPRLTHTYRR